MTAARRFLLVFFLPVLCALPFGAANVIVLDHAGELLDAGEVAALQQTTGGLYGTAIHPNVYPYKLALYAERAPEIVALGSSRVLQMSQGMFTAPFANLGRTVNFPAEAEAVVADMLAVHVPKLVLFGLDPWWLNPRWDHAPTFESHAWQGGDLTPETLLAPARWLADGRISFGLYGDLLTGSLPRVEDGVALYGMQAIEDRRGFRPDGSYYRGDVLTGRRPSDDIGFADTLGRVASDTAQFRRGAEIAPERLDQLRRAIATLQEAGVTVVTWLPPVAPPVSAAMAEAGEDFAWLAEARHALAGLGTAHLDAWDAATIGADACEFDDGFHNGETADLRILLALAALPGRPLDGAIDEAYLAALLARHAGRAQVFLDAPRPGEAETDFLGLDCLKG